MPKNPSIQVVTNELLDQKLTTLKEALETGFKGVHERQDTTNGKVIKAANDIIEIQKENIARDAKFRYNRVIWYLFTVATGLIVGLAMYVVTHQ